MFTPVHVVQSLGQAQAVRAAQKGLSLVVWLSGSSVGPRVRPGFKAYLSLVMWLYAIY